MGTTDERAGLVVELAAAAGLVGCTGAPWDGTGEALPTSDYDAWCEQDPAGRWADLVAVWLAADLIPSAALRKGEDGKVLPALSDTEPVPEATGQRRVVLRLLADVPKGVAPARDALAAAVRWETPLAAAAGPLDPAGRVAWVLAEDGALGLVHRVALSVLGRHVALSALGRHVASEDRAVADELLGRTTLTEAVIGGCSGARKEVRPVTIAICQIVVASSGGMHLHMEALSAEDWGIVVYVEVHLLSASVFQMAADISSRCRLGLTATLVREDGCEGEVFSRVGLKRFEVRWRDVEARGWIAPAVCAEVRVTLNGEERMAYALAEPEERYRVGASA